MIHFLNVETNVKPKEWEELYVSWGKRGRSSMIKAFFSRHSILHHITSLICIIVLCALTGCTAYICGCNLVRWYFLQLLRCTVFLSLWWICYFCVGCTNYSHQDVELTLFPTVKQNWGCFGVLFLFAETWIHCFISNKKQQSFFKKM